MRIETTRKYKADGKPWHFILDLWLSHRSVISFHLWFFDGKSPQLEITRL